MMEEQKYGFEHCGLFYGIYKAQVVDNNDPLGVGRLVLSCPTVHGPTTAQIWARPKASFGGKQNGLWAIPDIGEWVYVSFDHGRAEFPIWEGGWWADNGDVTADMTLKNVVLCTAEGLKIVINRTENTVLIQQSNGNSILIAGDAITVQSASQVSVQAPEIMTGNGGALQALATQAFLTYFSNNIIPFLQSKGYTGPLVPANGATTVLTAQ